MSKHDSRCEDDECPGCYEEQQPTRAGRREAAARKLLAKLPRCEWQLWDEERKRSVVCGSLATHMDLNFAECDHSYWCDKHKASESLGGPASAGVEWADAARELEKALDGGET